MKKNGLNTSTKKSATTKPKKSLFSTQTKQNQNTTSKKNSTIKKPALATSKKPSLNKPSKSTSKNSIKKSVEKKPEIKGVNKPLDKSISKSINKSTNKKTNNTKDNIKQKKPLTKNDIQNKKKSSNETIETKSSKERKNSKFGNIIDNLSLQQSINIKDKIKEENLKEQKEDQKSNFEGLTNKSSCEIIFNDDDIFEQKTENQININKNNIIKLHQYGKNEPIVKGVNLKPFYNLNNNNIKLKESNEIKNIFNDNNKEKNDCEKTSISKFQSQKNFMQRLKEIDEKGQYKAEKLCYQKSVKAFKSTISNKFCIFKNSKGNEKNNENLNENKNKDNNENKEKNNESNIDGNISNEEEKKYQLLKKTYLSPFIFSEKFLPNSYSNKMLNDYLDGKIISENAFKNLKCKKENTKNEEIRQKSFDDHKNENSKMLINKSQNEIDCLSYNRIMTLIDEKLKNIRNNEQNYIGNIFDRKILNRNTILPRSNSDLNCRYQDMNFYNNEPRKKVKEVYKSILVDINNITKNNNVFKNMFPRSKNSDNFRRNIINYLNPSLSNNNICKRVKSTNVFLI